MGGGIQKDWRKEGGWGLEKRGRLEKVGRGMDKSGEGFGESW